MRILAVDVGTGTQDILLYDTQRHTENCFKLVMPSPTMRIAGEVRAATRRGQPLLLTGVTMGGGPCTWAVRDHAAAGYPVFCAAEAARTFDDDLERVAALGITVISDDEAAAMLRRSSDLLTLGLHDFDYTMIERACAAFGLALDVDGVAVAVFDHGAAPPDVSDRQFRFDYLDARLRAENRLSAFAFPVENTPPAMTRLHAIGISARATSMPDVPLMVMDTAPAAVLGALLDPAVRPEPEASIVIANVGNFHTLAFRLGAAGIEGVFEHHTGEITRQRLEALLRALVNGTLTHAEVFEDNGHGALVYTPTRMPMHPIAVTGPRRALLQDTDLPVYFAVPFGDMMIAGCFGMVRAWADVFPTAREVLLDSLRHADRPAPWDTL